LISWDLANEHPATGSGLWGIFRPHGRKGLPGHVKAAIWLVGHPPYRPCSQPVKKVAILRGAGSFLVSSALSIGAMLLSRADMKYHEFFDADSRMLIADIGHYESEQFTIDLLADVLRQNSVTLPS